MLETGQNLLHYKIVSAIGAGGMGEVYLAEDTRLDRQVALKILPAESTQDADRLKRFIQEAKSASALNHPNIITIYEIGESDGMQYIATEFIEGETLRARLAAEPLSVEETLRIAVQIAEALTAAHAAGIIHRDIKPENIMLRADGYAKILDFGLAKLSEPPAFTGEIRLADAKKSTGKEASAQDFVQTNPGVIMGTVSYMSPEQARGQDIDTRTDIWSFGVVLYAMLENGLPFDSRTANDYIAAVLRSEPFPLKRPGIPDDLKRIVRKALKKDRDARYQTMKSLLSDLKEVKDEITFSEKLERSSGPSNAWGPGNEATLIAYPAKKTPLVLEDTSSGDGRTLEKMGLRTRSTLIAFGTLLVILGVVGYLAFFASGNKSSINSVAVLPFENGSSDPNLDYLSDGLSESVIDRLSQLPQLKVIARSSSFKYRGQNLDLQQIAGVLGVQAIVTGRVVQRGDDLSIRVEMMDAHENKQLWGEQYSRKVKDVVNMQQEIARTVSEKLQLRLSAPQTQLFTKLDTTNPQAYELLLKGKFFDDKGGTENRKKAREFYEQAVAADPNYALAYASLSAIYRRLAADSSVDPKEFIPKAEAAARKALELDETLAYAHLTMGNLHQYAWRWADAEAEYKRGIELSPNLGIAHRAYSQFLSLIGRHDEAIAEAKRARELDPVVLSANASVGYRLCFARRYDEAISELTKVVEMDANYDFTQVTLGYSYAGKGMYKEAIGAYQEAVRLGDDTPSTQIYLGAAYAKAGELEKAQAILKELLSGRAYVSPGELAILYGALGDKEAAFASLEKAYNEHDLQLQFLYADPGFDLVRDDPRFKDLLHRVGFPQ